MTDVSDMELVRAYLRQGSEEAFAELVRRHVSLVYSVALRHVGIAAHAEEITQAVFIILARKAASLRPDAVLEGWLYETARLTSLGFLRGERRRQFREQEAYMQSTLGESNDVSVWNQMSPLLDEAMSHLGKKDRDAVILRFFKDKNLGEVAAALNVTEAAAQRRVHRALEKLHRYFNKRGVSSTTAIIAGELSTNAAHAAPVALAKTVTAVALAKGATAGGSTLTLIKGALKIMAWTKVKSAIVVGGGILLAAGTTAIVTTKIVENSEPKTKDAIYEAIWSHPNSASIPTLEKAPPALIIRPTRYPSLAGGVWADDGKGFWVNGSVSSIIGIAYDWSPVRTIFPDSLPDGNYDVMESLPKGQNATALKEEIKKQFGLTAHKETRETDVFLVESE